MQSGNSVYAEAVVDINVGHVNPVVLINDIDGRIVKFTAYLVIQHLHNGDQLGHRLLEKFHGPGFQGLSKDSVVGVGAGAADDFNGVVHFHAMLCGQQADQLRDYHSRMGVIDLDDSIVGQVIEIRAFCSGLFQDQPCGVAYHEILLVDAQDPSLPVAVIGVEEQSQVFGYIRFVKGNTVLYNGFVHRFHIK